MMEKVHRNRSYTKLFMGARVALALFFGGMVKVVRIWVTIYVESFSVAADRTLLDCYHRCLGR